MARSTRARRRGIVAATATLLLFGLTPTAAAHPSGAPVSQDPAVLLTWNEIAWHTIADMDKGAKPPPVAQLYLGLVSTAVYNAVVSIEGGYRPTLPQRRIHGEASSDVAAATAAHDVLASFFPASAGALHTEYSAWLSGVPQGEARERGLRAGQEAAANLIASRTNDGRDAAVTLRRDANPAAGIWVPTASGEWTTAWLGFTKPILIHSTRRFAPEGPDPLGSPEYAADFNEAKLMGAATGSGRSAADTATALFWFDNPPRQYQDAMRDRAVRHEMDIVESARMFAAANAAAADTTITCWRAKYDFNFWRPETAIHQADRDGNPATAPDPAWTSFRPSPPYPEYPSGHGCVSSAIAQALENLFGEGQVDLVIHSLTPELAPTPALTEPARTRIYNSEDTWLDDVTDARIFLGIHFRDALDDARAVGRAVADKVVDRWFSPRHRGGHR
jgi:hypothetical protein